jgi:ATP-dependent Clp protease ATP-binding subunit ClpC
MMNQAQRAGNVILVIENIAGFVRAGNSIGVDIIALIEPYLGAPDLNMVFTENPTGYHHEVETLGVMQSIETIYIEPPSLLGTERLLEDLVRNYEIKYKTILTYPGLQAITISADRYIPTGVMPDKAIDLLVDIMGAANQKGITHITEDFVQSHIQQKTGIPIGPIGDTERETLLGLEEKLHARVVGQDAAITAISSAMRRARAGIQDAERPMGSFLFLGPTGVGKTETAKALANVFFGNESAMQRLDMSEFSGQDGLERLLGDGKTSGIISDMMKEHPYAVLLLDEFEKAAQSVHDLFLQILDEGRFTDSRGNLVNMRNTIVIATSNAGSQSIITAVTNNQKLSDLQQEIVNSIIKDGTYRPELINRFDGVILFEPLNREEQKVVAGYLVKELQDRMSQKGYTLAFSDDLISLVAEEGYNPQFGARPMRRVIQDQIEEIVARKIIAGSLKKGETITIRATDLNTKI